MKTSEFINESIPGNAFHPGVFLAEELNFRGISADACARALGLKPLAMRLILRGKRALSPVHAVKLDTFLDSPAEFWMRMQSGFEIDRLRIRMRSKIEKAEISDAAKRSLVNAI